MRCSTTALLLCSILLTGFSPVSAQQPDLVFENAFPNLSFTRPVGFENHGTRRVYIVQQGGEIYTVYNDPSVLEKDLFLDLSDRVVPFQDHTEAGLLSLAFHPNYADNGFLYVYYVTEEPVSNGTDTLHSVLARFRRSPEDPTEVDIFSEKLLLEIPQPTERHNGGGLAFGPEGYLFLSLGEGSKGGDAYDHAQNRRTLPGSVLRIDVDESSNGKPYGIPNDNPFVGNEEGFREEIYAYGFRNPWRLSIDPETGSIWVGDVGEEDWEEINLVSNGGNYGWPIMEGNACYANDTCSKDGLVRPVVTYEHSNENGACVTGGHVYRGNEISSLQGKLVYGDWRSTTMWFLEYQEDGDTSVTEFEPTEAQQRKLKHYSSFATDRDGELYYLGLFHGQIYRFRSASDAANSPGDTAGTEGTFELVGQNPVSGRTSFTFSVTETSPVRITLYDIMGREVGIIFEEAMLGGSQREVHVLSSRYPAGTYFVRMTAPGFESTRKLVLMP